MWGARAFCAVRTQAIACFEWQGGIRGSKRVCLYLVGEGEGAQCGAKAGTDTFPRPHLCHQRQQFTPHTHAKRPITCGQFMGPTLATSNHVIPLSSEAATTFCEVSSVMPHVTDLKAGGRGG